MTITTQAIATKYLGATNTRGGRIKATAWGGSTTVPNDYALDVQDNHKAAADALIAKMDWKGKLAGGGLKQGNVYVFVE
jgi:hypothetical protein